MKEWIAEVLWRLMVWAWPDLARLRPDVDVTRYLTDHARTGVARANTKIAQLELIIAEHGKLLMHHERALEHRRLEETAGATHSALNVRLAKVELMLMQPLSDGALELSEAQQRAIDRALSGARTEVVS